MKLIIAIISNKDVAKVLDAIVSAGFFATKISTYGQFLEDGHVGLLIGVEEKDVDKIFDILKENVSKRIIKKHGVASTLNGTLLQQPIDVEEYGGIAFVIDVEKNIRF